MCDSRTRVRNAKRKFKQGTPDPLPGAFQATQTYRNFIACCGEFTVAAEENEDLEPYTVVVEEYADRALTLYLAGPETWNQGS